MLAIPQFWSMRGELAEGCLLWQCGPLLLYLRRRHGDWLQAVDYQDGEPSDVGMHEVSVPDGLEWHRWACNEGSDTFRVRPVVPDRSVIVRPRYPLTLPPGNRLNFYVSLPLSVQVVVGEGSSAIALDPVPTVRLSSTWFGDYTEGGGQLCYAMRSLAYRRFCDLEHMPHRAICPIRVKNQSSEELQFDKMCLRVRYLSIYGGRERLWTTPVKIAAMRSKRMTNISYGQLPPDQVENPILLAKSPSKPIRGFVRKTFGIN